MKNCQKCGTALEDHVKFCPECGEKQNDPPAEPVENEQKTSEEPISILNLIDISSHPAKAWNLPEDAMEKYLFSLPFATLQGTGQSTGRLKIHSEQKGFIYAICNFLGYNTLFTKFTHTTANDVNKAIIDLKRLLDTDEKKYSWLLDMVFYDHLANVANDNIKIYMDLCRAFRIEQSDDFIKNATTFLTNSEGDDFDLSIVWLQSRAIGWEHILEYRGLNLKKFLDKQWNKLEDISRAAFDIQMNCHRIESDVNDFDTSDFMKRLKKSSYYERLNRERRRAYNLIDENEIFIRDMFRVTSKFIPSAEFKSLFDAKDKTSSTLTSSDSSLEWYFNFDTTPVTGAMSDLAACVDDIKHNIGIICEGKYRE